MVAAQIVRAADILRASKYSVALTGAGISVPSGIPDFRSPGSGLWEKYDPMEVASIASFHEHPERFYDWLRPLLESTGAALPNPAHRALSELQDLSLLREIVTQNIDGLHEAAGARDVLPVHGHTRTASCVNCGASYPGSLLLPVVQRGAVPKCERSGCGGVLKPDVVLFGEVLPLEVLHGAHDAAGRAEVMIVVGSSLEVFPVNELPLRCLQNGGRLLVFNKGPTLVDDQATVKIEADVAEILPAIVAELRR